MFVPQEKKLDMMGAVFLIRIMMRSNWTWMKTLKVTKPKKLQNNLHKTFKKPHHTSQYYIGRLISKSINMNYTIDLK